MREGLPMQWDNGWRGTLAGSFDERSMRGMLWVEAPITAGGPSMTCRSGPVRFSLGPAERRLTGRTAQGSAPGDSMRLIWQARVPATHSDGRPTHIDGETHWQATWRPAFALAARIADRGPIVPGAGGDAATSGIVATLDGRSLRGHLQTVISVPSGPAPVICRASFVRFALSD